MDANHCLRGLHLTANRYPKKPPKKLLSCVCRTKFMVNTPLNTRSQSHKSRLLTRYLFGTRISIPNPNVIRQGKFLMILQYICYLKIIFTY